jgi:hypothetical protein
MASPVRSIKSTKKVIRHKSKSPTRKPKSPTRKSKSPRRTVSVSQIQPDIHLESEESAYSDPLDSSRTSSEFLYYCSDLYHLYCVQYKM